MKVHEALNLYGLHANPEALKGHDVAMEKLKQRCNWMCIRMTDAERVILDVKKGSSTLEQLVTKFGLNCRDNYEHLVFIPYEFTEQIYFSELDAMREYFNKDQKAEKLFDRKMNKIFGEMMKINPQSIFDMYEEDVGEPGFLVCDAPPSVIQIALDLTPQKEW